MTFERYETWTYDLEAGEKGVHRVNDFTTAVTCLPAAHVFPEPKSELGFKHSVLKVLS
jgi:hypothetical protein